MVRKIEFFGMPGAGKSTQISLLQERLAARYRVNVFTDRDVHFSPGAYVGITLAVIAFIVLALT